MHGAIFELRRRGKVRRGSAEQTQFGVGIKAATLDPLAEKKIAAAQVVRIRRRIRRQQSLDLPLQLRAQLLVRVERKNPRASAFCNRRVLRRGEPLPCLVVDLGVERARDLYRAVGRGRVEYDDLIGELHTGQRACEIRLLVLRDDGNGERLWWRQRGHDPLRLLVPCMQPGR
jgi:hypothetical protein